ncbi:MAG TPA: 2-C-methyl-D-erythritol 2,4-cyclodiphosphate synthase, partial [Candidatus Dormibacteraeota bacterium]|nr:2-C-methyl-D-erythritol 2,4-cyclodiphosphate synthase [Candidatus Dormibacteraeota bacterium]
MGIGYDVHELGEGRALVLGGIRLDHPRGLSGHSDADVLTHAVIDAMLGAACLGDIGMHFPASDPAYAGISSLELLTRAAAKVTEAGYLVLNIDSVLIAQQPRLGPHLPAMAAALAGAIGLDPAQVSAKATSPEGLGTLGRGEG